MTDSTTDSSHYQRISFPVSTSGSGFISSRVVLDVCNNCGAVVGNKPAHEVFCMTDDGPDQ